MSHRSSLRAVSATVFCCTVALLAAPLPAAGQRLIVSYSVPSGSFGTSSVITQSIDLATGLAEWTEPDAVQNIVFTADGQYVFYRRLATPTGPLRLYARDVRTNQIFPLPYDFEPRLAHPREPAIFGLVDVHSTGFGTSAGTLARLDASGLRSGAGCPASTTVAFDLSADGGTMAALCESSEVVLLDTVSGSVIRTLAADSARPITSLRVNHDASRVIVTRRAGTTANEVAALDAVSGLTLATTTMEPANAGCAFAGISPDRTKAVVGCTWFVPPHSVGAAARVLDVDTQTLGPALASYSPGAAVFSPDNRSVFMTSYHRLGFGFMAQYDVATGASVLASDTVTPQAFGLAFAPLAPLLAASVSGSRVDLQWTLPGHSPAANRYVVEVGSATGLSNLGMLDLGPLPTLSVPAVPSGTYVVRVRAANATGVGAASNDVVVTVP